jgi:hypothetical protein
MPPSAELAQLLSRTWTASDCERTDFPVLYNRLTDSNSLCVQCGLCCNGAIFGDVKLQPGDSSRRLKQLGVPLVAGRARGATRFTQPCAAFQNGLCQVYAERPHHCREFECLLLKRVHAGDLEYAEAVRTVQTARERIAGISVLLKELGDKDEGVALKLRVQRLSRRLERNIPNARTADSFGQLTLAFHDLNLLLSQSFYPVGA